MAMLIAWQTLNKAANPQDARFTDRFLVVTPGHHDPRPPAGAAARSTPTTTTGSGTSCRPTCVEQLGPGQDRHHELPRLPAPRPRRARRRQADQAVLAHGEAEPVPGDARPDGPPGLSRAGRASKRDRRAQRRGAPLLPPRRRDRDAEDRRQARPATRSRRPKQRDEEATGVGVRPRGGAAASSGIKTVYDLSATPFFLRGSGYREGTLFPWVVSRLLADRRDRGGHREDPPRAGGRRRRRRRRRHLPQPVGAHPRRAAEEGAAQGA